MDIRGEVKKKIDRHRIEPYFGNRISELISVVKEVVNRNGRKNDPLTCEYCIESESSGSGIVCTNPGHK